MPPTRMSVEEEEEEEEEQGLDSSSCGLFRELHRTVNCIDRGRILVASTEYGTRNRNVSALVRNVCWSSRK